MPSGNRWTLTICLGSMLASLWGNSTLSLTSTHAEPSHCFPAILFHFLQLLALPSSCWTLRLKLVAWIAPLPALPNPKLPGQPPYLGGTAQPQAQLGLSLVFGVSHVTFLVLVCPRCSQSTLGQLVPYLLHTLLSVNPQKLSSQDRTVTEPNKHQNPSVLAFTWSLTCPTQSTLVSG